MVVVGDVDDDDDVMIWRMDGWAELGILRIDFLFSVTEPTAHALGRDGTKIDGVVPLKSIGD